MGKASVVILSVAYPALFFCGIYFGHLSPRILSILLVTIAAAHFLSFKKKPGEKNGRLKTFAFFVGLGIMLVAVWFTGEIFALKLYPVAMSLAIGGSFAYTLRFPPTMVFRFACLAEKNLPKSPSLAFVEAYCRKVTLVWVAFCFVNAIIAFGTAFASDLIWSLYNGLISYILMGILLAGEFMIRKKYQLKQNVYVPVSLQGRTHRNSSDVVCFSDRPDNGELRTWADFVKDVDTLRHYIKLKSYSKWILHSEDAYYFSVSLIAVLQCQKESLITANVQPAFIAEIKDADTGFLSGDRTEGADSILEILEKQPFDTNEEWPRIDPASAQMIMYTSGSTGVPKRVPKVLLQFENETKELVHLWGKDYVGRYFCSTVSHHHIYGLLLSVLVPLSFGLPFRRIRLDIPEELKNFSDLPCVFVASPAYLKRLVDAKLPDNLFTEKPFIHSSGGVLPVDASKEAFRITGFWPMEIYGSTETGGIAYRQSKDGLEWAPFFGCKMKLADNGCLNVTSSYILEPEGFTTGDLVAFKDGGKFLLKGRADSIVKIEEKRISLPEVERRLKSSGLVKDACAVALTRKRQFLAVAIVFNDAGRKQFKDATKLVMNNYFRDYLSGFLEATVLPKKWRFIDALPVNTEGKLRREDVEKLFDKNGSRLELISVEKPEPDKAVILVKFPETSDFFNGHFPTFKLLPAVVQVDLVIHWSEEYL
ncbi:MAG: AMP-binding protein, partial [Fibrobacteraceae bacterium]